MTPGKNEPQNLELIYAPRQSIWRRRWVLRWVIGFSFMIAILFSPVVWVKVLSPHWRNWLARRQAMALWQRCLVYTVGDDQIVYEEDEANAALLSDRANYLTLWWAGNPSTFRETIHCWPAGQAALLKICYQDYAPTVDEPTVFFHERINAHYNERQLLILSLKNMRASARDSHDIWTFDATSVVAYPSGELGTRQWTFDLRVSPVLNDFNAKLRFYAGQPDPVDDSHFTIRYAVNGQEGIIDGWLDPMSRVVLKVRDGPAK
jgi:hypothetical protein